MKAGVWIIAMMLIAVALLMAFSSVDAVREAGGVVRIARSLSSPEVLAQIVFVVGNNSLLVLGFLLKIRYDEYRIFTRLCSSVYLVSRDEGIERINVRAIEHWVGSGPAGEELASMIDAVVAEEFGRAGVGDLASLTADRRRMVKQRCAEIALVALERGFFRF